MYKIEVTCNYEQLWRYNIMIACGGYNNLAEQLYVVGCERITSETFQDGISVGIAPPENIPVPEPLILDCEDATSIHAIIYVITHTLPESRSVDDSPPFPIMVKIARDGKQIYANEHEVNQWGGATVNIKI